VALVPAGDALDGKVRLTTMGLALNPAR